MKLIIDSCLSEPPSEISCFRDITLYAKTYVFDDILLECPPGTRSMYWNWLKRYGAHDFISYLIRSTEIESGYTIRPTNNADITVDRITCENVSDIILKIRSFR
jgi:hypothetical protein